MQERLRHNFINLQLLKQILDVYETSILKNFDNLRQTIFNTLYI